MIDLGGLKNGRGGVSTRFHLYNKICVHNQRTTYQGYIKLKLFNLPSNLILIQNANVPI